MPSQAAAASAFMTLWPPAISRRTARTPPGAWQTGPWFLRAERSLIQTMGRAARNVNGLAILYADKMTDSLRYAISETTRSAGRPLHRWL